MLTLCQQFRREGARPAVCTFLPAGALLLGLGMCCTMVWSGLFVPGVAVGLAGIAAMAAALPLYNRVTRRERQKLAPLVRELTRDPGSPQAGC